MRRLVSILPLYGMTLILAAGSVAAQPLTHPLTPEQVACNESQLAGLLERLTVDAIHQSQPPAQSDSLSALSRSLLVTYSNRFGFFEGLAVSGWITTDESAPEDSLHRESFLAFSLNPSLRTTLANPARPTLPQISMLREEPSSLLVGAGSPAALAVFLNPTAAPSATSGRLEINNLQAGGAAPARSADTKPGRGLAGLTAPCHTELTDFDRFVFEILERVFRVRNPANAAGGAKVAIFRGEEPLTYRIDAYPAGAPGKVALDLDLQVDGQGRLQTGSLRLLPGCAGGERLGCTSATTALDFFLLPPVSGGSQARPESDATTALSFRPGTTPSPVTADFVRLLGKTAWNG